MANTDALRILIFHIRISMGHERAAQALAEAFKRRHPTADVRLVEAIGHSSGWLAPVVCESYLSIVKHVPSLWDFLYDDPRASLAAESLLRYWTRRSQKRFLSLMAEFCPHLVVCTQALPARILANLKAWGYAGEPGMEAPIFAVATDFSIHRYWVAEEIDGYFLPGEAESDKLVSMGVSPEKIFRAGIPIQPGIADPVPAAALMEIRLKYGLHQDRSTVLLMGGSRGVGLRKKFMKELENIPFRLNIVALSGTNPLLLDLIRSWAANSRHRVVPLQYTNDIRSLYALTDVAVTKPGGLTMAECMAVGLPMVISYALPGQERHNLEFARREKLAEVASSPADVAERVKALLENPARREELVRRLKARARPDAAFAIADELLQRLPGLPLSMSPRTTSTDGGSAVRVQGSTERPVSNSFVY